MLWRSESMTDSASSTATPWPGADVAAFAPAIDLVDHTAPIELVQSAGDSADDDPPTTPPALTRKDTKASTRVGLREAMARRKYAKWSEQRYSEEDERPSAVQIEEAGNANAQDDRPGMVSRSQTQRTLLERQATVASSAMRSGQRRLKRLFNRKYTRQAIEGDVELDILYENQRGTYLFGMPFFSSRSLLNLDPPAWMKPDGKPSPVNISDAQVPDPSWQWTWKSWYVDMSRDVDEDGWEYSFSFQGKFSWHGTHPWIHSFVRRRRWLRQRERKDRNIGRAPDGTALAEGHHLNNDYFTIHPARTRPAVPSYMASTMNPEALEALRRRVEEEENNDDAEDIPNMATLLRRIKNATIDRQKINAVLQFMDQGGDEVKLLADEIPAITASLLFPHSRRVLLSRMLRKLDGASAHRKEHQDRGAPEFHNEHLRLDNLLAAVQAADAQVRQLEYWSDVKEIVLRGESLGGIGSSGQGMEHNGVDVGEDTGGQDERGEPGNNDRGWDHGWDGLDESGPGGVSVDLGDNGNGEKEEETFDKKGSPNDNADPDPDPDSDSTIHD